LGVLRSIGKNVAVVSFDAHLDLRDDYLGSSLSHTTFMRRIKEDIKPAKILEIGTRAVCKEELEYAKEAEVDYLTAHQIRKDDVQKTIEAISAILEGYEKVYITIDMDVLDPAYVPAVQNPEPEGLNTSILLDILEHICERSVVGLDLVEVAPHYDKGVTATQAAKILFEALCCLEKTRKR
jgi:agmatinase